MLTACGNWEPLEGIDGLGLVHTIKNDQGDLIAEFEYNKNGTIKRSCHYSIMFTPASNAEYNYEYDQDDRLHIKKGFEPGNMIMSSIIGAMDHHVEIEFSYFSDGLLKEIKTIYHYPEYADVDYSLKACYDYSLPGVAVETIYNSQFGETPSAKNEYQLNKNGNIEKLSSYAYFDNEIAKIISETTFEYDNKHIPYSHEPLLSSKNNVTKKTITAYQYGNDGRKAVSYTHTYYYDYEYNDKGYPIKVSETMPSQNVNVKHYQYKKQ